MSYWLPPIRFMQMLPETMLPLSIATRLKTPTPTWRSSCVYLVPSCSIQTAVMHHCVIRQNGHNASTNTHTPSKFLVAYNAVSLLCDGNMAVASTLPTLYVIPKVQSRRNRYSLSLSKTRNNSRLIHQAIS